jgi:outer membrane protein OmpA-like peptidoglycan-associated protein
MKQLIAIIILIYIPTANIFSRGNIQRYNPFSGTIVLSFEGGITLAGTDYTGMGVDYLGRLSFEYFFSTSAKSGFGLRVFGSTGYISGDDAAIDPATFRTSVNSIGGGIIFILSVNDVAFTYLYAGISNLWFNPKGEGGVLLPNNASGVYSGNEINYNAELGSRFPVTPNLSLNISTGIQLSPNDWLDDKVIGTGNDFFLTILGGVSYSFLTEFDTDGDGVIDSKDACPNSKPGVKVDEFGCPLDSDHDGIADYLDECANTPRNVRVDKKGCPLDSDEDGVPDYTDICPGTPIGVEVDDLGCPYDLDADGIPDYMDKCQNTPFDVDVDKNGCPIDSDNDGVPDYLDQCPGTLPGIQVDEKGCEMTSNQLREDFVEPKPNDKIVLNPEFYFDLDKAKLKSNTFPKLDDILGVMKKYPLSRWRIECYTDNSGTKESSLKLSELRAESIAYYFIIRGVPKVRIKTEGFNRENLPVDNKTEGGGTENNRIIIIRLN